ncbi:MAG: hypothetical protein GX675_01560 [Erysipelotrichaceae bacterium]|nr:hypothetical protein [Erysipelotrichaceae bacterium]
MNDFMDDYGKPLFTLGISGLLYGIISTLVPSDQSEVVLTFFKACICFAFGISLYQYKKSKTWIKKLVVAFAFVFLLLTDMGYDILPQLIYLLNVLKIKGFILNLIYVFLGWTFFA